MTGFDPKKVNKNRLSKQLAIIFQTTCSSCYTGFDEGSKRPYILYPCQHYFCKKCVETQVLDHKGGACPECKSIVETEDAKSSTLLLAIIRSINKIQFTQTDSLDDVEKYERQIATELYNTGVFYGCSECDLPFDRIKRQPNIVCSNEHVLCSECLKNTNYDYCPTCDFKVLENIHFSKLIIHASQFIRKVLFSQTVKFVVNDKEYRINTAEDIKIKDIFFKLKDVGILSANLQIKDCHFTVQEREQKGQPKKVSEEVKVGDKINRIYLQFDERAMRLGSKVTMPSKIIKELPIRISDFAPIDCIKYEVDDDSEDQFGSRVVASKSELDQNFYSNIKKKQSNLSNKSRQPYVKPFQKIEERSRENILYKKDVYPSIMPVQKMEPRAKARVSNEDKYPSMMPFDNKKERSKEYVPYTPQYQNSGPYFDSNRGSKDNSKRRRLFDSFESEKEQKMPRFEDKKEYLEVDQLSNHERSLIKMSRVRSNILQDQKEYVKAIKKSRINRIKEAPLGTQIPPIFVQNVSTKLPLQYRKDVLTKFLDKHEVDPNDHQLLCYQVEKVMNKPFTKEEIQTSRILEQKIQQEALKGNTASMILKILKSELEDGKIRVIFSPKSTDRSRLTNKILTSHYLTDRFMIKEAVDDDERFFFEKLSESESHFAQYVQLQKMKYVSRFGFKKESIVVHNLIKGSKIMVFSTNDVEALTKSIRYNVDKEIEIHPYFTQLELSPEDFDQKGYIKFKDAKKDIEFRGNWPYYQPIKSIRYGINVMGKFDNGDNTWLKMQNVQGEWAVGFHGVRNPNGAYKECKNVLQSILSGLHRANKQMLINVDNSSQAFRDSTCACHPMQQVGEGVYLSPMFYETLTYTSPHAIGDKSYHLVFQCRLNPSGIHIPSDRHNYWVMRQSRDIRPYGIVLIETKDTIDYPTPQVQFGQKFRYEKYRDKIQAARPASSKNNPSNSTQ